MEPCHRAETGGSPVVVSQTVGMLGICGISILKSQYSNRWKRIFFLANGALLSYLCTISNFAKICILCRRVFHSGFQCKYMFYSSFRVKLSGIKAMAQKHLKWSISQKVLLQVSELLTAHKDMDVAHRGQNFHNGIPFKMKENI